MSLNPPLKLLFEDKDPDFAWKLLDAEMALDLQQNVQPDLVAQLLQLYMLGVEKMNSYSDWREAYFKEKVMLLMSKSEVLKTLGKKKAGLQSREEKNNCRKKDAKLDKKGSKIDLVEKSASSKNQKLHLREKRKQIETRLVYILQQNSIEKMQQAVEEQVEKQNRLSMKVKKIQEDYEDRLLERINKRKDRSVFSNSISYPQNSNRSINSIQCIQNRKRNKRKTQNCLSEDFHREKRGYKKSNDKKRRKSLEIVQLKIDLVNKDKKQKEFQNTS